MISRKCPKAICSHKFTLSAADLRALIDRTRFAMSTEETRYYLNGIYLHTAKLKNVEVLRAVATDGHRLARVEMPAPQGAKGIPGIILPRKTVNEVRKLIDESAERYRNRAVGSQSAFQLRRCRYHFQT